MSPRSAASYFVVLGAILLIGLIGYAASLLDAPEPEIRAGALGALATLATGIIAIGAAATVWIIAQRQREDASAEQEAAQAAGAVAISQYALVVMQRAAYLIRQYTQERLSPPPDPIEQIAARGPGPLLYPYMALRTAAARYDAMLPPANVFTGSSIQSERKRTLQAIMKQAAELQKLAVEYGAARAAID